VQRIAALQSIQENVWANGLPSDSLNDQLKGKLITTYANEMLNVVSSYAIPSCGYDNDEERDEDDDTEKEEDDDDDIEKDDDDDNEKDDDNGNGKDGDYGDKDDDDNRDDGKGGDGDNDKDDGGKDEGSDGSQKPGGIGSDNDNDHEKEDEGSESHSRHSQLIVVLIPPLLSLFVVGVCVGLIGVKVLHKRRSRMIHSNKDVPSMSTVKFEQMSSDIENGGELWKGEKDVDKESTNDTDRSSIETESVAISVDRDSVDIGIQ